MLRLRLEVAHGRRCPALADQDQDVAALEAEIRVRVVDGRPVTPVNGDDLHADVLRQRQIAQRPADELGAWAKPDRAFGKALSCSICFPRSALCHVFHNFSANEKEPRRFINRCAFHVPVPVALWRKGP